MTALPPCPKCGGRTQLELFPDDSLRCPVCGYTSGKPALDVTLPAAPAPPPPQADNLSATLISPKKESGAPPPALGATVVTVPPDARGSAASRSGAPGGLGRGSALGRSSSRGASGLSAPAGAEKSEESRKYHVQDEIARGGMGVILRVLDRDLRRETAMKVMLGGLSGNERMRFVEEAQVTGQLEHPNIVPIHDLGVDEEGRPFFTMKLVRGRSLESVLNDLRAGSPEAERTNSLPRLLSIFHGICNAAAFSHAKGVVHRDLKPANVMLGDFGEVLVMDWGLSKVGATRAARERKAEGPATGALDEAAKAAGLSLPAAQPMAATADEKLAGLISSIRSESRNLSATLDGTVTGTPLYMPPEQARGEVSSIDERSDIYSLGAILYEILTLKPPVEAPTLPLLLACVMEGRIVPPLERSPERRIPKELAAITQKAMAFGPEQRYQEVKELQADLELYQQGRAVSAKEDTFFEAAGKLVRRNKEVFGTTAVAAVVLAVVGGFSVVRIIQERNRAQTELAERQRLEEEKRQAAEKVQRDAEAARGRGWEAWRRLERTAEGGEADKREALAIEAQNAFRQALFLTPQEPEAKRGMRQASLAHFELALAQKNWRQAREKLEQARQVGLTAAEHEGLAKRLNEAETARERQILARISELMGDAQQARREVAAELGRAELISLRDPAAVAALLPFVSHAHPECQTLAMDSLAFMGDPRAALRMLPYVEPARESGERIPERVQLAALRALAVLKHDSVLLYETLRLRILEEPGEWNSLLYQRARDVFEPYAAEMVRRRRKFLEAKFAEEAARLAAGCDPQTKAAWLEDQRMEWEEQGVRELEAGQYESAVRSFDQALALNPKCCGALNNRGRGRFAQGDLEGALRDFDAALALEPRDLPSLINRGNVRRAKNDLEGALRDFDAVLRLAPGDEAALLNRGLVRTQKSDWAGALSDFDAALQANPNLAEGYVNRGMLRARRNDLPGAVLDFTKALELNPRDTDSCIHRGLAREALGDLDGALFDFSRALEVEPRNAEVLNNRGSLLLKKGALEEALRDLDHAVALAPQEPAVFLNRGQVRQARQEYDAALRDYDRALALKEDFAAAYLNRGVVRLARGEPGAALKDLDRALALEPGNSLACAARAEVRLAREEYETALSDLNRAVAADPANLRAWTRRAVLCAALDQEAEGRRSLAKVREALKDPEQRKEAELAIQSEGRNLRVRRLGKALEGKKLHSADEFCVRGQYRLMQGRSDEAREDFEAALAAAPRRAAEFLPMLIQTALLTQNWKAKLAYHRRWTEVAPEDANAHAEYAKELLGSGDAALRDPRAALAAAKQAVQLAKEERPVLLAVLAQAHHANRDAVTAIRLMERALALTPEGAPEREEYEVLLQAFRKP